jgi:hypothetical protein
VLKLPETEDEKQARLKKEAEDQAAKERDEVAAALAAKQEKKYSDEDVDRMFDKKFAERAANLKRKYGDLDELKAKADELDKLKEAGKGEAERLTDKVSKLEKVRDDAIAANEKAERDLLKLTTLLGNDERLSNLPSALKYISGNTEEEIKTSITELSALGLSILPKGNSKGNESGKDPFADMRNKAAQGSGKIPPAVIKEPKKFSRSQIRAMSKEEYKANREDIMKATAANLITND